MYVLLALIHCVFQLSHLELHAYRYTRVRTRTAMEVLAQRILRHPGRRFKTFRRGFGLGCYN